jgi:hypothetical protein
VSDDETERPELDAVRRLLADARYTDPIPAEVADRMDAVLGGLSQERPDAVAEVVPLDVHRRRRASGLLVAAAVIVVGGVVAAQQLPRGSGPQATTAGGERSAHGPSSAAGGDQATTEPRSQSTGPQTPDSVSGLRTKGGRLVVRPRHFQDDALTGLQVLEGKLTTPTSYSAKLLAVSPHCVSTPAGSQVVRATYERAPAALVYHPVAGTIQIVDLYVCGSSRPVRSVTLPTP